MRVGVLLPTYNRPDLARAAVLQLAYQSHPPDLICVHQNGHPDRYDWAVADLKLPCAVMWLHTPHKLQRQHQWYAIPLRALLEQGCTHFFWADHDELYRRDHIQEGLADLRDADFSVSNRTGLLFTKAADFRFGAEVEFTPHATGGMSSTMCFNRAFAEQLLADLEADTQQQYADNVVAHVTKPKFRCKVSARNTCIYHSHEGSLTSAGWLDAAFSESSAPPTAG